MKRFTTIVQKIINPKFMHTNKQITLATKLSKAVNASYDNLIGRDGFIAKEKFLRCLFSGVPKNLVWEGEEGGHLQKFGFVPDPLKY